MYTCTIIANWHICISHYAQYLDTLQDITRTTVCLYGTIILSVQFNCLQIFIFI